jgi:hypothetical protein
MIEKPEMERDAVLMSRYGFTPGELRRIDAEIRFVMWRWLAQRKLEEIDG